MLPIEADVNFHIFNTTMTAAAGQLSVSASLKKCASVKEATAP